jgi:hypothetical protein
MAPCRLPDLARSPTVSSPSANGLELAKYVNKRGRTSNAALDRLTTAERGQLLSELLSAHPDLVDQVEMRALALLAAADADELAESIEWTLREGDADQLAFRAGRIYGRGYVHENEAASEILGELMQPYLDDLARRAALGLYDTASQIGLGLLRGLAGCRTAVEDGTVLAYAGPDVTDELAWSVCDALTKAKVSVSIQVPLSPPSPTRSNTARNVGNSTRRPFPLR